MIAQAEYIESHGFIVEIIRTSRIKSADIRVEEGAVSVVVPRELTEERIGQVLKDKKKWIRNKILLHREAQPVNARKYISGESFSYMGRNYRLKVIHGEFAPVKLIEGRFQVTVPVGVGKEQPHMVRNALERWFKHHAQIKLQRKVLRYSSIIGVEPLLVGVKTFKSRWGSCSAKGKLDFNWKIIIAPNRMIDYVVVHELCHLKHHDHSERFWREVGRVIPEYAECREWLKDNAGVLEV